MLECELQATYIKPIPALHCYIVLDFINSLNKT